MLITVSGPAGVGTSTTAERLADVLGYDHVSGGDIFRSLAEERGMSVLEFNQLAEENDQIDRDLDRRQRTLAQDNDDLILESRLAGWMAGENADYKIWLDAPPSIRAARIADRENKPVETAREETQAREASEARRYRECYDIDIEDRSIYDLTINTARLDPDGIVRTIRSFVDAYDEQADEGTMPITGVRYEF